MATAIQPFDRLQLGIETTKGTAVAATRIIRCNATLEEIENFYRSPYAAGYRANVGGAGVITEKGFGVSVETELTAEEILWPLLTGVRGGVTPTAGGTGDQTWVFTPQLTTGVPTLDAATLEALRSDGATNHYLAQAAYAMTSGFRIDWAFNDVAKLSWQMFARARQNASPTGSLSAYASREELRTNLLGIWWDGAWADLGTTQLTGVLRSASFDCTTGVLPDVTMDQRADLDFVKHQVGSLVATLSLTLELDAVGAARIANHRANDLAFIRLQNIGSTVGAKSKTVQIDGAYRFTAGVDPNQLDGEQRLVNLELESVLDETAAKTLEFTAINGLSAVA